MKRLTGITIATVMLSLISGSALTRGMVHKKVDVEGLTIENMPQVRYATRNLKPYTTVLFANLFGIRYEKILYGDYRYKKSDGKYEYNFFEDCVACIRYYEGDAIPDDPESPGKLEIYGTDSKLDSIGGLIAGKCDLIFTDRPLTDTETGKAKEKGVKLESRAFAKGCDSIHRKQRDGCRRNND